MLQLRAGRRMGWCAAPYRGVIAATRAARPHRGSSAKLRARRPPRPSAVELLGSPLRGRRQRFAEGRDSRPSSAPRRRASSSARDRARSPARDRSAHAAASRTGRSPRDPRRARRPRAPAGRAARGEIGPPDVAAVDHAERKDEPRAARLARTSSSWPGARTRSRCRPATGSPSAMSRLSPSPPK